jgi:hypothetical protein
MDTPSRKLLHQSFSSSSLACILSLEQENQTIVEFCKWEEMRSPFKSLVPVVEDLIGKQSKYQEKL